MTAFRPAASLPHTGIATFCKAPYICDPAGTVSRTVIPAVRSHSDRTSCAPRSAFAVYDKSLLHKFLSRALPVRRDRIKR
jgi:hypothetical protein